MAFFSNQNMKAHIKLVHDKTKDFKCNLCDKMYFYKFDLEYHISQTHEMNENRKTFKCNVCEQTFFTQRILNSHATVHTRNRSVTYECEFCDNSYKYTLKDSLKQHIKTVHGDGKAKCN